MDREARLRAERRREAPERWPLRRYRLGDEPARDPLDATSVDERVAIVWALSLEMWSIAGAELPSYARGDTPGVLLRRRPR